MQVVKQEVGGRTPGDSRPAEPEDDGAGRGSRVCVCVCVGGGVDVPAQTKPEGIGLGSIDEGGHRVAGSHGGCRCVFVGLPRTRLALEGREELDACARMRGLQCSALDWWSQAVLAAADTECEGDCKRSGLVSSLNQRGLKPTLALVVRFMPSGAFMAWHQELPGY